MKDIDKFRQEIKRLRQEIKDEKDPLAPNQKAGYLFALTDMESFLDTISEEPDKSLEEEITRWLNEGDITDTRFDDYDDSDIERTARHFAEWQASQMPMPEDTVLFQKGVAEGRRLERDDMMKDAISCEIDWYDGPILNYPIEQLCEVLAKMGIDVGDKVRIIIVKEEKNGQSD